MYNNLNVATMLANGRYAIVLCADDLLHPNCLLVHSTIIKEAEPLSSKPIFLSHKKRLYTSELIESNWDEWKSKSPDINYTTYSLIDEIHGGLTNVCVNTEAFRNFGGFGSADPSKDFSRDVHRLGLFSSKCHRIAINAELVVERTHSMQNRHIMPKHMQLNEIYQMYAEMGLVDNREVIKKILFLAGQHLATAAKTVCRKGTFLPLAHILFYSFHFRLLNRSFFQGISSKFSTLNKRK